MQDHVYRTTGGVLVRRCTALAPSLDVTEQLCEQLDRRRGVLFASDIDSPGRYARREIGFVDPPLVVTAIGREFSVDALNARGEVLLAAVRAALDGCGELEALTHGATHVGGRVRPPSGIVTEERRSRQPSTFSLLRRLIDLFRTDSDELLGLYGAFGYDLAFQFDPIRARLPRAADQRDLVLYLPDELVVVDHARREVRIVSYDFEVGGVGTAGIVRTGDDEPCAVAEVRGRAGSDHAPGEYEAAVERARAAFARGDLFEAVLSQTIAAPCVSRPSTLFRRLRATNPAPYGALLNLGRGEHLVSASPEMFVRVQGRRVETCPISGTIARGRDALEDAAQIQALLNSAKDAAELTMCTDVDRNDKARVCEPGSVRVIGRRLIELYARLIHTVDHVEGRLRPELDALDAFLSHAWAVTVTGAPKLWATQFVEDNEKSARRWYGGAFGALTFDGNVDTGLTLRTIRLHGSRAEVRVGATLLHDSDPTAEGAECQLKATALLAAIAGDRPSTSSVPRRAVGEGRRILLVDHEDSFVHTLGDYLRQTGAGVTTLRHGPARRLIADGEPFDLVVLSPGPGRPADFALGDTLDLALARGLPVFGVCLGLQGLVEHLGGTLDLLGEPVHGKASRVRIRGGWLFQGLSGSFEAGRYHSLVANRRTLPAMLEVTAETDGGVIMAVEHRRLPVAAVQFHPESIMTLKERVGHRIIENALLLAGREPDSPAVLAPLGRTLLQADCVPA